MKKPSNDNRTGPLSRLRRFYRDRPVDFAWALMGISVLAVIVGAYMLATVPT